MLMRKLKFENLIFISMLKNLLAVQKYALFLRIYDYNKLAKIGKII